MPGQIERVTLDDAIVLRNEDIRSSANNAINELVAHSQFDIVGLEETAPYRLHIAVAGNHLRLGAVDSQEQELQTLTIPLLPLRRIIKDYFIICESYHRAIENAFDPSKVEAIDMGRRGLHNEGADILNDLMEGKVSMDFETARRLFTLIHVLHMR